MITVALPTWNNKDIVWLAMEGLIRQKDSPDWELLILECRSENEAGSEFFENYWPRLQKAGCVRIKYMFSETRMALNQKWLKMAREAHPESRMFLLQGSDDYPHPDRNYQASIHDVDWYDCRYYYQYHVALDKLLLFDNEQLEASDPKNWKTGFNMAIRTEKVRNIKSDKWVKKGVDFWLMDTAGTQTRHVDQNIYKGVSTTGLNTISNKRFRYFVEARYPFKETDVKVDELAPKPVVRKLKELKELAIVDQVRFDSRKVKVTFKKAVNGRPKGYKTTLPVHALNYYLLLDAIHIDYRNKPLQKEFEKHKEYENDKITEKLEG